MSTTNWVIAIIIVAILGVGAYFVFDKNSDGDAMMNDGTGTSSDAMMFDDGSTTDSTQGGDMMSASGTVNVY